MLRLSGEAINPLRETDAVKVFLFVRSDCPISNRYAPEVRRLFEKFSSRGVAFWLVYPDPDASAESIRRHLAEFEYPCQALRDPHHALVRLAKVRWTPEAAVFTGQGAVAYRGRIDDRYIDFNKSRPAPTRRDLEEALEAVLAGEPVEPSVTPAVGCFIQDLKRG